MTPWYRIQAAAQPKTADIFIFGDIGDSWWSDQTITAQQFVKDLAAIEADTLNIRINSQGGAVSDGIAIYNALRRHPAAKAVTIEGVAVSIASLIAMAGDTIDMPANSMMMIHAPWGTAQGNAIDLRNMADMLDRFATAMATSYAIKSGKPESEMLELLTDGANHWYTAPEALAAGFADTISDAVPIAAFFPISSLYRGSKTMPDQTSTDPGTLETVAASPPVVVNVNPATPENVVSIQAARQEVLAAEQERRHSIRALLHGSFTTRADLRAVMDECLDDPACTSAMASKRLLATLGESCEPVGGNWAIAVGQEASEKSIAAGVQALLARCGADKADGQNPYRGLRLHEMARACLSASGANVAGMTPEEFVPYALGRHRGPWASGMGQSTSDFPVILENTLHKLMLIGFSAQPQTYQRFCKIGDVTDFRAWKRLIPGLIGNLDDVNEAGEYLNKNIPDATANSITAKRRGNIVTITPEIIINDDMGYVSDFTRNLGAAGARTIERKVYALLESNPTLADGIALFHASHGNLSSTSDAISVAALDAGRSAMAVQKAPGEDQEYLDIQPMASLCHTGKRSTMQVTVNAEYDPDTANKLQKPNAVRGIVSDIVSSPRLSSATAWYLFADPNIAPVLEVVFLNGQREPRIVQEESFRTGGLSWRIEMPFGVGAIDFRGGWKNPGA